VFFCYDLEASVSGTVFQDMDADGAARESDLAYSPDSVGEPGEPWQTVYVDYDGDGALDAGEPSATTGEDGGYTIPFVAPGTWRIRLARRVNSPWTCSYPSSCSVQHALTAGAASTGNDFGIWQPSYFDGVVRNELTGEGLYGWTVYADYDGDGTLDEGEPSALTGTKGEFLLTRIRPGTRTVREVVFPSWNCTTPNPCAIEQVFYSARSYADQAFVNSSFQDLQ
jgi:hypothetical protein